MEADARHDAELQRQDEKNAEQDEHLDALDQTLEEQAGQIAQLMHSLKNTRTALVCSFVVGAVGVILACVQFFL